MPLIAELKRRNVFKVAMAYVIVAWLCIQFVDVSVDLMGLPEWIGRAIVLALLVGFPIAMIFAWAFEMTPEGIKKESEVDRSKSITHTTSRKLDFLIIAVLVAAVGFFTLDKWYLTPNATRDAERSAADDQRQTVAVLPFVDMSPAKDQAWIGEVIATEMQTALSKRSDFLVLSRSTTFAASDDAVSSQEIGRTLGVDVLVEGTIRRVGDRIRVTVQLVSVVDGYQLWSDVYEARLRNDFSAEVAVANFFSNSVRAQLSGPFMGNVQISELGEAASSGFGIVFGESQLFEPVSLSFRDTLESGTDAQ